MDGGSLPGQQQQTFTIMHLAAIQQIDVRRTAFCLRRVTGFTQP